MSFLRSWLSKARDGARANDGESEEPPVDVAEQLQKLQRGVRRLSLASDQSNETLTAVAARLDAVQQLLLEMKHPRQAAVALEEAELLLVLDEIDRAMDVTDLSIAARTRLDRAKDVLLARARWQAVAVLGAKPEGTDVRVAEYVGGPNADGGTDARIHRVLQQGYRRGDGTLLRYGVVVAEADSPTIAAVARHEGGRP